MEDQIIRRGSVVTDHDRRHVPALAGHTEDRGMVPQHGVLGSDRVILRHGHLPAYIVLRHRFHSATRPMAVSKPV